MHQSWGTVGRESGLLLKHQRPSSPWLYSDSYRQFWWSFQHFIHVSKSFCFFTTKHPFDQLWQKQCLVNITSLFLSLLSTGTGISAITWGPCDWNLSKEMWVKVICTTSRPSAHPQKMILCDLHLFLLSRLLVGGRGSDWGHRCPSHVRT